MMTLIPLKREIREVIVRRWRKPAHSHVLRIIILSHIESIEKKRYERLNISISFKSMHFMCIDIDGRSAALKRTFLAFAARLIREQRT